MYNLYIYEKNQSLKDKNKNEEEKSKKIKLKRKAELSKLSSNYDKRMNDFIFNLCYHPIFIKDYTTDKNNNQLNRNQKHKNFSFGGFMTDKNRINLINQEKELNKKYEEKTLEEKNKKKKNKTEKQKIFIQPRMRFKPRNELERIIEVMDLLGKGINSQKLKKILVQLNHTDFDKVKQSHGFGKLKQIYKYKYGQIENNDSNIKIKSQNNSQSSSSSEDEKDLDFTLEINLHRKLRNINLQLKRQKKLQNKRLKDNETGVTLEKKNILNNIRTRNKELLELFKDDEKIYFKGASQYAMNFNNIQTNKNKNVRIISAMPFYNKVNNFHNYTTNNKKIRSRNINKINLRKFKENWRPMSMNNINNNFNKDNNDEENKNKMKKFYKEESIKKLGIQFQIKKRKMDEVIKKEINNSMLNKFYSHLNKKEYSQYFSEPYFLEKNSILLHNKAKTIDSDLDNKLNYLRNIININNNENRKIMIQSSGNSWKKIIKKDSDFNKIIIEGKRYEENDIKNIANAIFTKCGYYNKKIIV